MRKKLLFLMTLIAVLTAGCVQADIRIDVNDDGSGTYSAVFAVNADLFKQLGGLSALDPDATAANPNTDICQQTIDEAKGETPEGAKIEPYKKGDFCGYKVSAPFKNPDEAIEIMSGGTSSSGGASLENVTLEKQGTGWVFNAEWKPDDAGASTGGADQAMMKQFLQGFSFVVRMKLPGGQVDQNADLIEGDGTMVWNLDPVTSRTLKARTEPGAAVVKSKVQTDAGKNINTSAASTSGSGSSSGDDGGSSKTWLYVVIALVVVGIIAAIVLMKRNKAKTPAPITGMPGAPMAPGPSIGSPPMGAPMGGPTDSPQMAPPASAPAAAVATAPQPGAGEPQWDAARNAYIQWDGVNQRWMQYDQTAGAWKPIQ